MKNIILILFATFCLDSFCQTNKKPIPGNDTISMPNDMNLWGFPSATSLLYNDKDPEGNAMKVTTFRIDSTTVDKKANEFVYIKNKAIITIKPDGRLMVFPFPLFDGVIRFSYVVNDYFSGVGKRASVLLYIHESDPIIVNLP